MLVLTSGAAVRTLFPCRGRESRAVRPSGHVNFGKGLPVRTPNIIFKLVVKRHSDNIKKIFIIFNGLFLLISCIILLWARFGEGNCVAEPPQFDFRSDLWFYESKLEFS